MTAVDIIVPVFSGFHETVACFESLLRARNRVAHEIVAVYDAGPDPRLLRYLEDLAAKERITLLMNSANVGFVKAVNRGLALHPDRDVLVLNSDTEVADHWLDRLVECARQDPRIATVTPFSNNAEICSFPRICQSSELPQGWSVADVDSVFAKHVTPAAVDLPTAIGFCMFVARRALDEVGYFDEGLFGRGYGEENDLCRKLAARQWRNVLCTNVFVYHRGGVSFGGEKAHRIATAMQIIDRLYPDYHRLVHEFIADDPPQKYRVQAQLALLATDRPRILCVMHNLDGGTTKHVRELADYLSARAYFFVARMPSGEELELSIASEWGDINLYFQWPNQADLFWRVIASLGIARAHIHHVKDIETFVRSLMEQKDIVYDVTLHDYYLINGNPALADRSGQFCADVRERDDVCAEHSVVPLGYTASQWRRFSGELLRGAQRIFVPSRYTASLYAEYFPYVRFTVTPHPDWEVDAPYPSVCRLVSKPKERFRVVVLGALGLEKGADILEQTAVLATKRGYPVEFHLLGYAYRQLNRAVIVHGAYDDSELHSKLAQIAPHLIWFPCQWPETYSYTLSACFRGGHPVLAPALGAFIERAEGRPLSWLEVFPTTSGQWLEKIVQLSHDVFAKGGETEFVWREQPRRGSGTFSYASDYIDASWACSAPLLNDYVWFDMLQELRTRPALDTSIFRRESILRFLLRVRQARVLRVFGRLIPFSFQRRIKRSLSTRALHQVARDLL